MSDHPGFLRAILATPSDDRPRLVYADWLEESGDTPRAAFIRVQCALAAGTDPGRLAALRNEQWALVSRHLLEWEREFARDAGLKASGGSHWDWDWGWVRGFIDDVVCSARDWLAVGAAVRALQPVRLVRLKQWTGHVGELTTAAVVAGLDTLRLSSDSADQRAAAILADAAGGTFHQLHRLELDMPVSPGIAERIRDRLTGVRVALRSEFH